MKIGNLAYGLPKKGKWPKHLLFQKVVQVFPITKAIAFLSSIIAVTLVYYCSIYSKRKLQLVANNKVGNQFLQTFASLPGHGFGPYSELIHELEHASFSRFEKQTIDRSSFTIHGRRTVVIAVGNEQLQDYVNNLNCFVHMSTGVRPIIFSLDFKLTKLLNARNIPTIQLHSFVRLFSQEALENDSTAIFGTKLFSIITHAKTWVTYRIMRESYDLIMTDLDVIWCKNMMNVFSDLSTRFSRVDIFMQSNQSSKLVKAQVNTGFYYVRSNQLVLELYKRVASTMPTAIGNGQDDQGLFSDIACCPPINKPFCPRVKWQKYQRVDSRLECHWNSSNTERNVVKIQYLPLRDFPNGYSDGFNRRLSEIPNGFYRRQCFARNITIWHANFCTGRKKRRIMQDQGVFFGRNPNACIMHQS